MEIGLKDRYPQLKLERDKLLRDVSLDSFEIEAAIKGFEELVVEIEAKEHYQEHQRVVSYLKAKYDGYNGVPVPQLEAEFLLDANTPEFKAIKEQIKSEMGKKTLGRDDFVDFAIVADALLALKELR